MKKNSRSHTAGLEDYASPIAEALEARHGPLAVPPPSHRLFRCSTTPSRSYPCVKDLSRLGRDPRTTVLVEDTALAGLAQPDSVVPVMPWRGGGGGGGGEALFCFLAPSFSNDEGERESKEET